MGRVTPKYIKKIGLEIYKKYKDRISESFEENKKFLNEIAMFGSKKVRNVLAGYLTRLAKKKEIY